MRLLLAATVAVGLAAPAHADVKDVWGGGDPEQSSYSGKYVPYILEKLAEIRLSGYKWGGPTQGTVDNAERVTNNPTNLAVGQLDILKNLNGEPMPSGGEYAYTILKEDLGPECLYLVTANPHYSNFGHVLANAWDITIATGGKKSGSYGTLKVLLDIYPDLQDAIVRNLNSTTGIIDAVVAGEATFGFFIMRPDPKNAVFDAIDENDLSLVPVVDFDLESEYEFKELKIANAKLMGLVGNPRYHTTACTSVALITGDPGTVDPNDTRTLRRVQETIKRFAALDATTMRREATEKFTTWSDFIDNFKEATTSQVKALMEESRQIVDEAVRELQ